MELEPHRGAAAVGDEVGVFSLSVYVIRAAGAREGLTLHRPSQHSGNEPHFSFSVPPKLRKNRKRQSKETRKCFSTFCLTTLQAAALLMRTSAQTMFLGRDCFGGEEKMK